MFQDRRLLLDALIGAKIWELIPSSPENVPSCPGCYGVINAIISFIAALGEEHEQSKTACMRGVAGTIVQCKVRLLAEEVSNLEKLKILELLHDAVQLGEATVDEAVLASGVSHEVIRLGMGWGEADILRNSACEFIIAVLLREQVSKSNPNLHNFNPKPNTDLNPNPPIEKRNLRSLRS